jgi:hypothetical protein
MDTEIVVPKIILTHIELMSISYLNNQSIALKTKPNVGQISVSLRLYAKTKNSFKVKLSQIITFNTAKLRTRHEAIFSNEDTISKKLFSSEVLQEKLLDILFPFNTELFAFISAKSFGAPIIAPSHYSDTKEKKPTKVLKE